MKQQLRPGRKTLYMDSKQLCTLQYIMILWKFDLYPFLFLSICDSAHNDLAAESTIASPDCNFVSRKIEYFWFSSWSVIYMGDFSCLDFDASRKGDIFAWSGWVGLATEID